MARRQGGRWRQTDEEVLGAFHPAERGQNCVHEVGDEVAVSNLKDKKDGRDRKDTGCHDCPIFET